MKNGQHRHFALQSIPLWICDTWFIERPQRCRLLSGSLPARYWTDPTLPLEPAVNVRRARTTLSTHSFNAAGSVKL